MTAPVAVCRRDRGSERRLWKPSRPLLAMTLRRGLPGLMTRSRWWLAGLAGRSRGGGRGYMGPISAAGGQERVDAGGGGRGCDADGMQRLLNAAALDADGARDDVRGYVARHLGSADGVLVVDGTEFRLGGDTRSRRDGVPLVRPDKHIGWRSMTLPHDSEKALRDALTQVLSR